MLNYNPRTASHIGVLVFQVGESSVQGEGNSVVCGTVSSAYANCSGSSEAGSTEQMWSLMSFSKHLLKMGVRATGPPVVQACDFIFLRYGHNGGFFEA